MLMETGVNRLAHNGRGLKFIWEIPTKEKRE